MDIYLPLSYLTFIVYFALFVFGVIFGSYANSWVWRVHTHNWKLFDRSKCVHCARTLVWYENFPLFSFLVLDGVCRTCKKPIPQSYFWVELASGLLFVLVAAAHLANQSFAPVLFARDLFFAALLLVVFIYDAKYQIIPTSVVWAGGFVGVVFNLFVLRPFTTYLLLFNHNALVILGNLLIGAAFGWAFFAAQYYGSRGRWVGGGDVRLGAMLGAWLGWPLILVNLFLAYILGALVAMPLLILKKKQLGSAIPFGTFLSVAAIITILYGQTILNWYLSFLR